MGNLLWLASYPKSGNTWTRAFIENYLQDGTQPVDINTLVEHSQDEAKAYRYEPYTAGRDTMSLPLEEICALRSRVQADMAAEATGTVFAKTHNFMGEFAGYPLHNLNVTAGAIYIVRNPLDVVLSLADYFAFTIDEAIAFMAEEDTGSMPDKENVPQVISSWSTHVASWTQTRQDSLVVVRYEDLLDKPQKYFAKVAAFLGQERDPNRLKKAIKFSSFKQLKSQEQQHGFVERHEDAGRFFRKGQKNQWRERLSRDQVKAIVDRHRQQMKRFKYVPMNF
jgi:hypothetical protein